MPTGSKWKKIAGLAVLLLFVGSTAYQVHAITSALQSNTVKIHWKLSTSVNVLIFPGNLQGNSTYVTDTFTVVAVNQSIPILSNLNAHTIVNATNTSWPLTQTAITSYTATLGSTSLTGQFLGSPTAGAFEYSYGPFSLQKFVQQQLTITISLAPPNVFNQSGAPFGDYELDLFITQ